MKLSQVAKSCLVLVGTCEAFLPAHRFSSRTTGMATSSARSFGVDPNIFHDLPSQIQTLKDSLSTISLSDAMDAAMDAGAVVDEAAKSDNGWFGFLTTPIELLLQGIHSVLVSVGLSADAWGLTIIVMTLLIKLGTFPLTKTQLESTNKMQVSFCVECCLTLTLSSLSSVAQLFLYFQGLATCNQGYSAQVPKQP